MPQQSVILRPSQLGTSHAQDTYYIPRPLGVHGHYAGDILDDAEHGEQDGRWDGNLGIGGPIVVFHAVLPRDTGEVISPTVVIEGLIGAYQLSQFVLGIGIRRRRDGVGPAEIVQAGDSTDAATDGDDVSHGLID